MSSPALSFQTMGLTAQTAVSAAVSVAQAPAEILSLPAGTVLPAIVTPPENSTDLPTITVSMPDGKEVSFQARLPHVPETETPVTLKFLPAEFKNAVAFKVNFDTALPDIHQAAKGLEMAAANETDTIVPKTESFQAFVLRSVPEQITALLEEIEETPAAPPLPPNAKVAVEITSTPFSLSIPEEIPDAAPAEPQPSARPLPQASSPALPRTGTPLPTDQTIAAETLVLADSTEFEFASPVPESLPVEAATVPTMPPAPVLSEQPTEQTIQPSMSQETPVFQADIPETAELPPPAPTIEPDVPISAEPLNLSDEAVPAPSTPHTPETILPTPDSKPTVGVSSAPAPTVPAEKAEPLPPATVKGIVFQSSESAPPVIATKIGVLALEENIQLPHLTPVTVKVSSPAPLPPAPDFSELSARPTTVWSVLTEALDTLHQTDETAFEAVKNILPQTGDKLPALMLSFMRAASQGVPLTTFIGEANVAALRATGAKGERQLNRLEKELSVRPKQMSDGQNMWKSWNIPFLTGSVVEPVSLFLQRPSEDALNRGKAVKAQPTVRFVLDLNLSGLGKMQLEGLAHRPDRRFDLIIRHQDELPSFFDTAVRHIFTDTLTALNYSGTVKTDRTDEFIYFTEANDNTLKRGVLV